MNKPNPSAGWVWKMAWRDSRQSRRRLLLFVSSMIMGVAALVAIGSFRENLQDAVDGQARALLGADLMVERNNQDFSPEMEALIDSVGGRQTRELEFTSMIYFPSSGGTRLGQVRAMDGTFPFYGEMTTVPPGATETYQADRKILIDKNAATQFGVAAGDSVRVGRVTYAIAGVIDRIPGENSIGTTFGPRVFLPRSYLDESLLDTGSRVEYKVLFQFATQENNADLEELFESRYRPEGVRARTAEDAESNWGEAMGNLNGFLSLVGFIALLLGSIGVASSIHVYIKNKIDSVATLRCVGATFRQAFTIYLIQALAMGLFGALVGAALGMGIQFMLPAVVADFLPVDVEVALHVPAVLQGVLIGLAVTLSFALLPLLSIRNISPLRALRSSYEATDQRGRDPIRWVIYAIIAIGITLFALQQTEDWVDGLGFAGGLAVVFGLLVGTAKLIIWVIRRFFPSSWTYVWRQGLANLYRPNNQTVILMLALGLGTFLIMTLFLIQRTLIGELNITDVDDRPNMVMFDIQDDQRDGVKELVAEAEMKVFEDTPIVTMRILEVKGRNAAEIQQDTTYRGPSWAFRREYRSSYRNVLSDSETIVAGTWHGDLPPSNGLPYVSVESDIAQDLGVTLGDEMVFDVQGLPIRTQVGSIREVDWRRVGTNFFIVFQNGVLEEAPKFHVLATYVDSPEQSAMFQRRVVETFPNISIIDLDLILSTADAVLAKVSFVIRFMALFSILTGLVVLIGSVLISRFQRIRESVLLRTLGASGDQIVKIMVIEYLFLGCLATITGLILSLGGTYALAYFTFEVTFVPPPVPILIAFVFVSGLTILIGMFNSRGIYKRPPLEILRAEM